jgi:hypothetical protein
MIALSLSRPGDLQLLSPLEIARFKFNAGVVVLSGCSSGRADVLPAAGLMGLTRAWLAGGARAVVASHWPTPAGLCSSLSTNICTRHLRLGRRRLCKGRSAIF